MPIEKSPQQLFAEFIKECQYAKRLRSETIRGYTEVFHVFVSIMPEVTELKFLTMEMLSEFFKRLQTRERIVGIDTIKIGVKNSTIKTYQSKLNVFFEWLHRKALIQENPMRQIKPPELTYDDVRALNEDSVRKLYAAVSLHSTNTLVLRRDTAMLSLLLFSGVRFGEFISIEVRDIDFDRQILTVRGQTSKSQKSRAIPLHTTLQFHLKDYIAERNKRKYQTQYLFVSVNSDCGLTRYGLKHWVKKLSVQSGVHFHIHQFRHSFATNLALKDVGAVKIQKLLGHSSLEMTMTYLRSISTEDMRDDINRLSI